MVKVIHKYGFTSLGALSVGVHLPISPKSKILSLQVQRGTPSIWVECDTDNLASGRTFVVYGTGHQMPEDPGNYIGTFQLDDGTLVLHLYEVPFGPRN